MPDATDILEDFKVDITVIQARQLPNLKTTFLRRNRKFYVIVVDSSEGGTRKTKAIRSERNTVTWNENMNGLRIQPSGHITLYLYAETRNLPHRFIGIVKIDPGSKPEASYTIENGVVPAPIIDLAIVVHASQPPNAPTQPLSTEENKPLSPAGSTHDLQEQLQVTSDASAGAEIAMKNIHVLNAWKGTIDNVQSLIGMVKTLGDVHPVAKLALSVISAIPEALLKQIEADEQIHDLVIAMCSAVDLTKQQELLRAIQPNSNQALILKVMLRHIATCGQFVEHYAKDGNFRTRFFKNIVRKASDEIDDLCDTLSRLRKDLLDNAIINMQIAVHLIQKSTNIMSSNIANLDFDAKINDLPYRSGWSSTAERNGCLEGTREDFLQYILQWIKNPSSVRALVLFGQAGTGKSSIAFEIASRFCFDEHPGSYFAFSRAQKSTQKDHHLFTTIIRDMSDHYPSFKLALGKSITNNTPLRTSDDFNQLFSTLLLEPLETVGTAGIPDLIVIDGLDESVNPDRLASFLSRSLKRLPENFRVLITSRPEGNIEVYFKEMQESSYEIHRMNDRELITHLDDDIRLYFRTHLSEDLFQRHGEELVRKAEGLFQWAAVACGYLNKPPPGYTMKKCLRGLIGQDEGDKQYTQGLHSLKLYTLYDEVLSAYFISDFVRVQFRYVVGHLFYAFEPLSINTLAGLQHFVPDDDGDDESVVAVVKFLGSLLSNVTSDDRYLPVIPLHTSFRDFLVDTTNMHPFSLDSLVSHTNLTHACLDLMLHELKFNICELESSHLRNADVIDLQMRVEKFISPPLFYACRFWYDHLDCITLDTVILNKLDRFFSTKLLFWFEVLSVTNTVPLAVQAIASTLKWLQKGLSTANPEIEDKIKAMVGVVSDALTFIRPFGNVIATSAPHIYVSSLPFTPKLSEVYKIYSPKFPATLSFIQGQLDYWPALEMTIIAPHNVCCVEFSPDGQWIASGMDDGTICLWNTTTGIQEGSTFKGYMGAVQSIAFSSDGQHIISSSEDYTIYLWNVATGTMEGNPWVGHTNIVNSVVFSPDGAYAVSGSKDKTIRIWNVANGSMEGSPLTGHTGVVTSVAFSSDGEHVISGSEDCTVRVWTFDKVEGRVEIAPLLTLHTPDSVLSVAISPNGQQIAAGCLDHNIYLWNTLTEPIERIILTGHTSWVICVKFLPDGRHIISGGSDSKLCTWNTSTNMVEGILSHGGGITTLALSLDGQRIVSGDRRTLNIWNATAATRAVEPAGAVTAHIGKVSSIAYSPVSKQNLVASGSVDGTICLWNVKTKGIVASLLQGHTGRINSIAFSPNGQRLVSSLTDHTVRVWNVDSGMEETTLTEHVYLVSAVAFSPDGQWIVSVGFMGRVLMWNTSRAMESRLLTGCSNRIRSMGFSPDSRQVVASTSAGAIWVWDISEQENEGCQLGQHKDVSLVSFITNDRIISCDRRGKVDYWSTSTGKIDGASFDLECGDNMTSLVLSPNCSHLSGVFYDGSIFIWNLATQTREDLSPMIGHTGWVTSLAFSPDGHQLISGSEDSTIRVWDISGTTSGPERPLDPNLAELNEDGWLVGKKQELLIWIPQHCRPVCRRPDNLIALFPPHLPHFDFSQFVHGADWHSAYKGSRN